MRKIFVEVLVAVIVIILMVERGEASAATCSGPNRAGPWDIDIGQKQKEMEDMQQQFYNLTGSIEELEKERNAIEAERTKSSKLPEWVIDDVEAKPGLGSDDVSTILFGNFSRTSTTPTTERIVISFRWATYGIKSDGQAMNHRSPAVKTGLYLEGYTAAVNNMGWLVVWGGKEGNTLSHNYLRVARLDYAQNTSIPMDTLQFYNVTQVNGTAPSPREKHASFKNSHEELFIYGGNTQDPNVYSISINLDNLLGGQSEWKKQDLKHDSPVPTPREDALLQGFGCKIFMGFGKDRSDAWILNRQEGMWTAVNHTVFGDFTATSSVQVNGVVFLFGGTPHHNDIEIWKLDLKVDSLTPTYVGRKERFNWVNSVLVVNPNNNNIYIHSRTLGLSTTHNWYRLDLTEMMNPEFGK